MEFHYSKYVPAFSQCHSAFLLLIFFHSATDKVALLIGNLNYNHHPALMAPIMDVHKLANLLQHLDFRVVSLLDLTLQEMQVAIEKFLQLLGRGVYGESRAVVWGGAFRKCVLFFT